MLLARKLVLRDFLEPLVACRLAPVVLVERKANAELEWVQVRGEGPSREEQALANYLRFLECQYVRC